MPGLSQILSASYPKVLAQLKKDNQFAESALLREMERQGAIKTVSGGPTIECPLDYQRNPGASTLATDVTSTSTTKTDVLSSASYTPAMISVPVVWTKADEAQNPSENQKVDLVRFLLENAVTSHDDLLESIILGTSSDGFLGLKNLLPNNGQGTIGGINAAADTWWRNYGATYVTAGTNILTDLTTAWNAAAKGTGTKLAPSIIVSSAAVQALYESKLQPNMRFINTEEADGGLKVLAFKTARYIFSPYGEAQSGAGTGRIFGFNPSNFRVVLFKGAVRDLGETVEFPDKQAYVKKMFTMGQFVTSNKSRGFVLNTAT